MSTNGSLYRSKSLEIKIIILTQSFLEINIQNIGRYYYIHSTRVTLNIVER